MRRETSSTQLPPRPVWESPRVHLLDDVWLLCILAVLIAIGIPSLSGDLTVQIGAASWGLLALGAIHLAFTGLGHSGEHSPTLAQLGLDAARRRRNRDACDDLDARGRIAESRVPDRVRAAGSRFHFHLALAPVADGRRGHRRRRRRGAEPVAGAALLHERPGGRRPLGCRPVQPARTGAGRLFCGILCTDQLSRGLARGLYRRSACVCPGREIHRHDFRAPDCRESARTLRKRAGTGVVVHAHRAFAAAGACWSSPIRYASSRAAIWRSSFWRAARAP
jgi:hypothetical protein